MSRSIPLRLANLPEFKSYLQPVIATDKVRYVGEPVAVVVAETQALAEDALEAIELDIERLPALPDRHAAASDKSLLFDGAAAIARCATRRRSAMPTRRSPRPSTPARRTFRCHRLTGLPLETRGQIAEWDAAKQRLTVFGATKVLFFNRRTLAPMLGVTEADIDMIEVDVGGGFGVKGEFYPEDFLIPFAARLVGRPVKWIEDRREHLIADQPFARGRLRARDRLHARRHHPRHARARLRRHGRLYPHQRRRGAGQGRAIPAGAVPHPRHRADGGGLRHQQDAGRHLRAPGRFEANFFRERLLDIVAGDLGLDPMEFRRRNLISEAELPFHTGKLVPYEPETDFDTGDYHVTFERALSEIGWDENKSLQGRLIDGRYHGLAAVPFVESGGSGKENCAAGDREGRLGQRLCRLVGAGAGAGDDARAGRRRHAEAAVRARSRFCTARPPIVREGFGTFASRSMVVGGCGGDGWLQQSARRDPRGGDRAASAFPTRRSRSRTAW